MLLSYLTSTLRNLRRNKAYALINLLGMSIGLTAVVLLAAYVDFETGFDRGHGNGDRLYRVLRRSNAADGTTNVSTSVSGALGRAALESIPGIESTTRVWDGRGRGRPYVTHGDVTLTSRFWHVDPNFLDTFDFPLIRGDRDTVFDTPNGILISESAAQRWFGDENPVGRTMSVEHSYFPGDYVVAGVLADPPEQSTLRFEIVTAAIPSVRRVRGPWEGWSRNFAWIPVQTWLLVDEDADIEAIERGLQGLMMTHLGPEVAATDRYHLQRLDRVHLYQNEDFGIQGRADIRKLELIGAIVGLLLVIACINFTNLSAARSLTRAREVGVRKATGARRSHLLLQFSLEAVVLALAGLAVSLAVAWAVIPAFADLIGSNVRVDADTLVSLLPFLFVVTVAAGVAAGLYPALFLSSLDPSEAVKPGFVPGSGRATLRKALVLFQFAASVLLLIGASALAEQMAFVRNKELGFDRENLILLPLFGIDRGTVKREEGPYTRRYNQVKDAFLAHPKVLSASAAHSTIGWGGLLELMRTEKEPEGRRVRFMAVDEDYVHTHGIELIAGRDLDGGRERDKLDAFILNETAVRQLGWTPETAIGRRVGWIDKNRDGTVVGVVADFHNRTLEEPIGPVVLAMWQSKWNVLTLRIAPGDVEGTIADLEALWNRFLPTRPFWYSFLDEDIERMYGDTVRFQSVCTLFSGLAVGVACIGLIGLVSFTIERRTKEIGIRKVLGASEDGLLVILLNAQLRPVLLANLVAWPVAAWLVDDWLSDFAYRTTIGWPVYLSGSLVILGIALLAVLYHVLSACRTDPVHALRYE